MNMFDRVCWITDTNRLDSDSPHLRHALMKAAQGDHLDVVKKLLSIGVDATDDFGQFMEPFFRGGVVGEQSLIEISFASLSGKVASFLLENDLVPEANLSDLLVTECVNVCHVSEPNVAEKVLEKATHRVKLLSMLGQRGCFPINLTERRSISTMGTFLSSLDHHPTDVDHYVPVTPEVLDVLCEFGGDIVSAMEEHRSYVENPFPSWIFAYIDNIKANEKFMNELLSGTPETADEIVAESEHDITTLRDRCGRSLLELAATAGKSNWVEWLVNKTSGFRLVNSRGTPLRDLFQQLGYAEFAVLHDD